MSELGTNLGPEFSLNPRKEAALVDFGKWWDGKVVARGTEFENLPSFKTLNSVRRYGSSFYTLLTHHTPSGDTKAGIIALGGVLYAPDTQQTLFYGGDAGKQLQASLGKRGVGQAPYGKVKDGKTFVYLHPIPYELNEDARVYEAGPNGFSLAKAFSDNPPDYNRSRFNLEQVLQAPWAGLDAWLSTDVGLKKIAEHMPELYKEVQRRPEYIYRVKMAENRYLIAVV